MNDGSVVLVEMFGPRVTRIKPDGKREVIAEIPGGPNGAAIGPDGALYLCNNGGCFTRRESGGKLIPGHFDRQNYRGGRIQRVDLSTGAVRDLYTEYEGQPLGAPNDLVFDAHGGFYFSDHGTRAELSSPVLTALSKLARRVFLSDYRSDARDLTALYYARPDGSFIERVVSDIHAPNGVGLSPDGRYLYWAETINGRLCRRTIVAPGKLMAGESALTLCALPGIQMLDSLGVDSAGNVCVGTLIKGGITVCDPTGKVIEFLPTGDRITTNICFGGPDLSTAYITLGSTGRLVSKRWPRPGLKLNYNA